MPRQKTYTEEDMERALRALEEGGSLRRVAAQFHIPHTTLQDRRKGRYALQPHPNRALMPDEEEALLRYIFWMAAHAFPITKSVALVLAIQICKRRGRPNPFVNMEKGLSKMWWSRFRARHPTVASRRANPLERERLHGATVERVDELFHICQALYDQHEFSGTLELIYNCDETGFGDKGHSRQRILCHKGQRCVYAQQVTTREHITVHCCANAAGESIPPFVIFRGSFPSTAYGLEGPQNALYGVSEKGYMDSDLFLKWLGHFVKYARQERPLLLFMDQHEAHPLDVAVYGSLKAAFSRLAQHGAGERRPAIGQAAIRPGAKARAGGGLYPHYIISGFRRTGLFPLNRMEVDESKLVKGLRDRSAGGECFDAPEDTDEDMSTPPCTVEGAAAPAASTSTTDNNCAANAASNTTTRRRICHQRDTLLHHRSKHLRSRHHHHHPRLVATGSRCHDHHRRPDALGPSCLLLVHHHHGRRCRCHHHGRRCCCHHRSHGHLHHSRRCLHLYLHHSHRCLYHHHGRRCCCHHRSHGHLHHSHRCLYHHHGRRCCCHHRSHGHLHHGRRWDHHRHRTVPDLPPLPQPLVRSGVIPGALADILLPPHIETPARGRGRRMPQPANVITSDANMRERAEREAEASRIEQQRQDRAAQRVVRQQQAAATQAAKAAARAVREAARRQREMAQFQARQEREARQAAAREARLAQESARAGPADCAMCGRMAPAGGSGQVLWLGCDSCTLWYHAQCVDVILVPEGEWYCPPATIWLQGRWPCSLEL
ncbi:hypothetical protein AALO_G00094560 [Alosa alosa]|uniref:HTH CENPB-type domain-containing protein n=1 Tax=Alosa alosa TaxID=278164 RepID=A0AAV6GS78_9TELE|nr:hypothetical protein AALO_G00094560 [Alosa alosa]